MEEERRKKKNGAWGGFLFLEKNIVTISKLVFIYLPKF